MKKIGIFYGSSTGMTADVANQIADLMGVDKKNVYNVADTDPTKLGEYELIILGSSTHGNGELQEDWYDFLAGAQVLDLSGHNIAIFGLGDETMSETFCNAVGELYFRLKDTGAEFIGEYPADVYNYTKSEAQDGELMRGLLLDNVNRPEITSKRLQAWIKTLK